MEVVIKRGQHLGLLLDWICQWCLKSNDIAGFFDHEYLWRESIDILIFCIELAIKGRKHLRLPLLICCGQLCLSSNQIAGFFIINIPGRNQLISQIFCSEIIIKGRQNMALPVLVGCDHLCLSSNQILGFFKHQYQWKESIDLSFFTWRKSSREGST